MMHLPNTKSFTGWLIAVVVATLLALSGAFIYLSTSSTSPARAATTTTNGPIAFSRAGGISTINPDGTNLAQLVPPTATQVDYSYDGSKITYQSSGSIIVANVDGTNPVTVYDASGGGTSVPPASNPTLSPDKTKVAYQKSVAGLVQIFVKNADGTGTEQVIAVGSTPSWSPDGSKIMFARGGNLFLTDPTGSTTDQISGTASPSSAPAWNYSGNMIAYTAGSAPDPQSVRVADISGTTLSNDHLLVSTADNANFSPDNTKVVYNTVAVSGAQIHTINLDGSGDFTVTSGASSVLPDWQAIVTTTFDFTGFFRPVDNPPTVNSVKAGQAIPVKFSLNGNQGLDIFAAGSPSSVKIDPLSGVPIDVIEETVNPGNSSLQYDPVSDTYTYVWKTDKAWKGHTRELNVTLTDGTSHTALFKFK
jgi:hypothetical protein